LRASLRLTIICLTILVSLGQMPVRADTTPEEKAKACSASEYPLGGLKFLARGDQVVVKVPWLGKTVTDASFCWLTKKDLVAGGTCPATLDAPPPYTIATCTASDDAKNGTKNFNSSALNAAGLASATALIITFNPTQTNVLTDHYLRFDWKEGTTAKNAIMELDSSAAPPDYAADSRYKFWLYTGYTFLRTQNDFKDSFPELRARFESRLLDERLSMMKYHASEYDDLLAGGSKRTAVVEASCVEKCGADANCVAKCPVKFVRVRRPTFAIMRSYGDVGLTGTTVVTTDTGGTAITNKTRRAFDGNVGFGYGRSFLVAPQKSDDTSIFAWLAVVRLGMVSIPGQDADPNANPPKDAIAGATAYSYFIGPRLENETGHYEGAYSELAIGETSQFTRKKVPRLRFDGLLPFNDPGNWFRIALRLQVDSGFPFTTLKKNKDGTPDTSQNQDVAGEIRISALFNIDVMELANRLGVPQRKSGQ
jgi:hypothetical protein